MADGTTATAGEGPADAARQSEAPMFSRTGYVGPYGALICEIKTKLDIDADLWFRRYCAEQGGDPSSVIRNWINEEMRGVSYDEAALHAAKRRAEMLSRKGPIRALSSDGTQLAGLQVRGEVSAS